MYIYFRGDPLENVNLNGNCKIHGPPPSPEPAEDTLLSPDLEPGTPPLETNPSAVPYCAEVYRAFEGIKFIADHTKREEDSLRVSTEYRT